jgi:hypothetical protein
MFRLTRIIIGHYLNHIQTYQVAVYILGIAKCITEIRSCYLDMPSYGSNNDLMMTGEWKHVVTSNDNKAWFLLMFCRPCISACS